MTLPTMRSAMRTIGTTAVAALLLAGILAVAPPRPALAWRAALRAARRQGVG